MPLFVLLLGFLAVATFIVSSILTILTMLAIISVVWIFKYILNKSKSHTNQIAKIEDTDKSGLDIIQNSQTIEQKIELNKR
ncbi:MAG: hypothetical protein C0198_05215 [Sulfurihydrogenibium sp.]|nr:MAG: hypothetical protein C0198_05215 [Sulfurihydrogenibium sp.]